MNAHIEIFLGNQWVAAASLQAYGDDRCRMEYLAPYIFGDQPAPLSLTMPVEFGREPMLADGSPDRRPPPFLYDLVPQGRGRQLLVNLLARADSDDLVLPLLMTGAFNPIGRLRISSAVTFYQDHIARHAPSVPLDGFTLGDMQAKSDTMLEQLALHAMLASGTTGVQGVAPKFLLTQRDDGLWFPDLALPDPQAREHWLVKLPRGRTPDDLLVHRHEAAYLRVAQACGVRCHGAPMMHGNLLFVRRFDRRVTPHGVERLHQESVASLVGLRGFGTPTTQNHILAAIRRHATDPLAETIEFLKRDVLNMALRNTDNHARNTAMQILLDGTVQLTPLFDFAPMYRDPEVIPRAIHWFDGDRRVDHWAVIVATLDVDEAQRTVIAQALKDFGREAIDRLETVARDCGVEEDILQGCQAAMARVSAELQSIGA